MSIATLFREIFLRLNTLAEQLKTGLAGQRNTAEQTPEPESEIPETADPAGLSPIEPQELPADREDRPLSDAELTDIADRIAERLSNSQPETAPGSTDMPIRQVPGEDRPSEPQAELPSSMSIPQETIREIAELTAERLAAQRIVSEPSREEENRGTAVSELSAKLDTILAAVKSNGEQIRKIAEIDTNTIFFS